MIKLRADGYEVHIDPEQGGQVLALTYCDRPVLRPAGNRPINDPTEAASFPLVPFSNRIDQGRFAFRGRTHALQLNFHPEPHAIHGEGWKTAWTIREQDAQACALTYRGGGNWPWPYQATQTVEIDEDGVLFAIEVENKSDTPFPVGAGFHPYFERFSDTVLQFDAKGVLTGDRLDLAEPRALPEDWQFQTPRTLAGIELDHCFYGWTKSARFLQPRHGLSIDISTPSPTEWTTVYVPKGADFFCFEPVSHATGAFNRLDEPDEGVVILDPAQSFRFEMRISATRTDAA